MTHYPHDATGWAQLPVALSSDQLLVGDWQVMEAWEEPLMAAMAREVTAGPAGDILEIGFGMGISARHLLSYPCQSYTVIEAHPTVAQMARDWLATQPGDLRVIEGAWQDVLPTLSHRFDGILFDTYPWSPAERGRNHFPFIPEAPRLLTDTGTLVCYSDETIDFRGEHLRLLLEHFTEVKLVKVSGLCPPPECEYWQYDHMVVPVARCPTRRP